MLPQNCDDSDGAQDDGFRVVTERVECADVDFETTMEIIKVISAHNDYIFNVLDRERPEGIAVANSYSAATRKTILAALPGYFKTEDMKDIAAKIANGSATGRAGDSGRGGGAGEARRVQEGIGRRREPRRLFACHSEQSEESGRLGSLPFRAD